MLTDDIAAAATMLSPGYATLFLSIRRRACHAAAISPLSYMLLFH